MAYTVSDCNLKGDPLKKDDLSSLSSEDIAVVVGTQMPGNDLEDADNYVWSFKVLPIEMLRFSNEYGEEPEGGWKEAYLRHQQSDREAVASGSIEYEGRDRFLEAWSKDTLTYPLYVVEEDGEYRLLDGYHRLAGAFWHDVNEVAVFVGSPKPAYNAALR